MAQIGTDDILIAIVYAVNKAADAEQQLGAAIKRAELADEKAATAERNLVRLMNQAEETDV